MGLHIEEGDVVLEDYLLEAHGIMVVKNVSTGVWSDDGEIFFGSLGLTATVRDCITLYEAYAKGFEAGKESGARELQYTLRALLGVSGI